MTLFLTDAGAVMTFRRSAAALRMQVHDQLATVRLKARQALITRSNYFIGNDPKKWRTDVTNFGHVAYVGVRPGVDLVYHGSSEGRLEYDFVVAPGASPDLSLDVEGADALAVARDGSLEIHLGENVLRQPPPRVYQDVGGQRRDVAGRYRVIGKAGVGFVVAQYDRARPLVIDPVLLYSTYLGGSGDDYSIGMAVDPSGAAYVTGYTNSTDFPIADPLQPTSGGGNDVFVAKLTPAGNALAYATYLGGSGDDQGGGVAIDASGAAYVAGSTSSTNFPVVNPIQATAGGASDVFVIKLAPAGNALSYSTYLGGAGDDYGNAVAVDSSGAAYLSGVTYSANFPVVNPFQATRRGATDAFVAKLTPAGNALAYSTYLGGSAWEVGLRVAVDASGAAYVTGRTASSNFPVANPFQATFGGVFDAFVTKLTPAGNALVYSTYLGGSNGDSAAGVAVDASGAAYVTGATESTNFPVANALQATSGGGYDAFVTKLTPTGNALAYSTYLGGSLSEFGYGLAVDPSGAAYVTGQTNSTDFPTANPFQATFVGTDPDAFVAKLAPAGNALAYSTYLGGGGYDHGIGLAVDASGAAYLSGYASSANFPVVSALQSTIGGATDSFIAKISPPLLIAPSPATVPPRSTQTFAASGGTGSDYMWSLPTNASGGQIDAATGVYTAGATGSVTDTARVVDSAGESAVVDITVGPQVSIVPVSTTAHGGDRVAFAAMGGSGAGYVWSLPANASGGNIDATTGTYFAGATAGVDTVHVDDSLGNSADAMVTVIGAGAASDGCGCTLGGADNDAAPLATALVALLLLAVCMGARGQRN